MRNGQVLQSLYKTLVEFFTITYLCPRHSKLASSLRQYKNCICLIDCQSPTVHFSMCVSATSCLENIMQFGVNSYKTASVFCLFLSTSLVQSRLHRPQFQKADHAFTGICCNNVLSFGFIQVSHYLQVIVLGCAGHHFPNRTPI